MTIDEFDEYAKAHDCVIFTRQQYEHVIDVFNDYELLLFDYYGRLKVDMVDMLKELKEQLREMHEDFFETEHFDEAYGVSDSMDVIQQKINELVGGQEGEK